MSTCKVYVRKSKKGSVLKVIREHYLRGDVWCGSEACQRCKYGQPYTQAPALDRAPHCNSNRLQSQSYYILPDTNILLHQIDVLDDESIKNVIILQTVLEEIRHRNTSVYKRVKELLSVKEKRFYTFVNEFNRETYIVHRLLAVAVNADSTYADLLSKQKTQVLCNNLNYRHRMAQYAGRASVSLHTQLFFASRVEDEEGYILSVRKNALQVLVPKYGLEATLYLKPPPGTSPTTTTTTNTAAAGNIFTYDEDNNCQVAVDGRTGEVVCTLSNFDPVLVQLSIDRSNVQRQRLALRLVHPQIRGFSVSPQAEKPDGKNVNGKVPATEELAGAVSGKKMKTATEETAAVDTTKSKKTSSAKQQKQKEK